MKTRLGLIVFILISSISFAYAQSKGVINNTNSPKMKLKSIDVIDCQWTDGFWADKLEVAYKSMIPNLGRLVEDPDIIHAYDNFKVAAGLMDGEFRGWSFTDGDFYKCVEAMAFTYAMTKDEKLDRKMDEYIGVIAQAQMENGYLHTMKQIGHGRKGFLHESEHPYKMKEISPFTVGGQHEFYNFGHLMTAACVHHRITGKRNFLDIAIKASDHIYELFKVPSPKLAKIDWNPPHYMGLVEMYRTTGDKKYLELAETFINMLGTAKKEFGDHRGMDHSQRGVAIREESEAVGHAGHGNYLYAGVTDLYAETGEKALLDAMERIWNNVTTEKMYVTGATGPHHFGVSKKAIVAESYGVGFEMPNINAYNETCANLGNAMWNWRMFLLNGEARFADVMELIFYNSGLSGISLDGNQFYYTNPLRFIQGHPQNTKDQGQRSDFMSVFCCPPNIIRTIAKMHTYAYSKSEVGLWVNLYGSNKLETELLDGSKIKLTQKSNYPWDGNIKLVFDNTVKKPFSMMLRIPSWVTEASIKINGKISNTTLEAGSYYSVHRSWKKGDVIELNFPMTPFLVTANPNIEETRNQVAVKRGPIVYCLESIDLPNETDISQVVLPQHIKFKSSYDKKLLSGVTYLSGEAELLPQEDWSKKLYKPLTKRETTKTEIKMIPYYAWSNRGLTDMTVWLPLKY